MNRFRGRRRVDQHSACVALNMRTSLMLENSSSTTVQVLQSYECRGTPESPECGWRVIDICCWRRRGVGVKTTIRVSRSTQIDIVSNVGSYERAPHNAHSVGFVVIFDASGKMLDQLPGGQLKQIVSELVTVPIALVFRQGQLQIAHQFYVPRVRLQYHGGLRIYIAHYWRCDISCNCAEINLSNCQKHNNPTGPIYLAQAIAAEHADISPTNNAGWEQTFANAPVPYISAQNVYTSDGYGCVCLAQM